MSIVKLDRRLFSSLTLTTNAPVAFVSHSNAPLTGAVVLFNERSNIIRSGFDPARQFFIDDDLDISYLGLNSTYGGVISGTIAIPPGQSLNGATDAFLNSVNALPVASSQTRKMNVLRFETPFVFDANFAAYRTVKQLYRYYRSTFQSMDFSFRNYNSINFFSSSNVPQDSCLIYLAKANQFTNGLNPYLPSGPFTIDFYLNPRYTTNKQNEEFSAGTLAFMSSSYAVSLVTGSLRDNNGLPSGYRLVLQLSSSVDISPDLIDINIANGARSSPQDLIFVTKDNSLLRNHWHHVAIRWGGAEYNNYTGSIYIDGKLNTEFVVPSGSISSSIEPNCLFIGARYEGTNSGASSTDRFFNSVNATVNGTPNVIGSSNPAAYTITNKLNAEFHELKLFDTYRNIDQIYSASQVGITSIDEPGLKFYLPPFFTKESPKRYVLAEPYSYKTNAITQYPFEVTQSMGLRSRLINIENFLRDFATGQYPLPYALTGSVQSVTVPEIEINDVLYRLQEVRARNLLLLPNDNGLFRPAFSILQSGSLEHTNVNSPMSRFTNDFNTIDLSKITLRNVIEIAAQTQYDAFARNRDNIFDADAANSDRNIFITNDPIELALNQINYSDSIRQSQKPLNGIGLPYEDTESGRAFIADNVNIADGYFDILSRGLIPSRVKSVNTTLNAASAPYLSVPYLLGEYDSQELYFFNVPNLFYGDYILPGSIVLQDPSLSGSNGCISITLKDNGGALYRSDSITPIATWNDIGNVFYNEGILVIKNPLLPHFGKESFSINLSGTRDVNVFEINIPCPAGLMDSSSNPTYKMLRPNNNINENANNFTYVTAVNLHDDNLNILGRAVFSQPIRKRPNDGFLTRIKIDF